MSRAVYVAELVDKSTPEQQPNRALYELLLQTLRQLPTTTQIDVAVRWFEMQSLTALGYRPQLDRCVRCQAELMPTANYFSGVAGGVICQSCAGNGLIVRPLSLNALKVMRLMQHSYVEQVLQIRIDSALAEEIEGHLREYLYTVLERQMKSTAFVQMLKREALTEA
jgi:DNA repair protein RecO (recombination protein O)